MNTKDIGNIAEASFIFECMKRNTKVSIPYGDNLRYDFIVDINNCLFKVQVKHMKDYSTYYGFSVKSINWNSGKVKNYKNDVDFIYAFCKDDNRWVLFPISDITNYYMHVRKIEPKNKQEKRINKLDNYIYWFDKYVK